MSSTPKKMKMLLGVIELHVPERESSNGNRLKLLRSWIFKHFFFIFSFSRGSITINTTSIKRLTIYFSKSKHREASSEIRPATSSHPDPHSRFGNFPSFVNPTIHNLQSHIPNILALSLIFNDKRRLETSFPPQRLTMESMSVPTLPSVAHWSPIYANLVYTISFLFLSLATTYLLTTLRSSLALSPKTKSRNGASPPIVPYSIPLLGNLIPFATNTQAFMTYMR